MKTLKSPGYTTEPRGTPLITGLQLDIEPLGTSLHPHPLNSPPFHSMSLQIRMQNETMLKASEKCECVTRAALPLPLEGHQIGFTLNEGGLAVSEKWENFLGKLLSWRSWWGNNREELRRKFCITCTPLRSNINHGTIHIFVIN